MKIVAFANQKGGVGKTTTAVTLAHGLALRGLRTLLVDLDPQGHVAYALGLPKSNAMYRWICLDEPWHQLSRPPGPTWTSSPAISTPRRSSATSPSPISAN